MACTGEMSSVCLDPLRPCHDSDCTLAGKLKSQHSVFVLLLEQHANGWTQDDMSTIYCVLCLNYVRETHIRNSIPPTMWTDKPAQICTIAATLIVLCDLFATRRAPKQPEIVVAWFSRNISKEQCKPMKFVHYNLYLFMLFDLPKKWSCTHCSRKWRASIPTKQKEVLWRPST